jgi:hypothetical protein
MIMGCCAREHHIHANARDPAFYLRAVAAADQARRLLCGVTINGWSGRLSAGCFLRDLSLKCVMPCSTPGAQPTPSLLRLDTGIRIEPQAVSKAAATLDFTSLRAQHSSRSPQRFIIKYGSTHFRALCDLYKEEPYKKCIDVLYIGIGVWKNCCSTFVETSLLHCARTHRFRSLRLQRIWDLGCRWQS